MYVELLYANAALFTLVAKAAVEVRRDYCNLFLGFFYPVRCDVD